MGCYLKIISEAVKCPDFAEMNFSVGCLQKSTQVSTFHIKCSYESFP